MWAIWIWTFAYAYGYILDFQGHVFIYVLKTHLRRHQKKIYFSHFSEDIFLKSKSEECS